MSRLDSLPADQKATLQLLLKQGKTYDELAGLLRLDRTAVRDRALDALAALGPEDPGGLTEARQDELGDYLLGQQTASARQSTREFLEGSGAGRTWARAVATELRPLAGDALPDIPAEGAEVEEAFGALGERREARERQQRSSKLGGILLIAGAIAVAVVLILVLKGGNDNNKDSSSAAATTAQTTSTPGQPSVEAQINLRPVDQGSKALGVAQVVRQGNQRGVAIAAQGLPQGNHYAVWLYTSPGVAKFLGFAPAVGKDGRLSGATVLQGDTSKYKQLVLTRESVDRPKQPGAIVLSGALSGTA